MDKHGDLELCIKWAHLAQERSEMPEVRGLFAMCEAALHEKLERSKGCPTCMSGEVMAWDVCNDGIVIESDGKLHMLSGGSWEAQIYFCPKCGRRLNRSAREKPAH